MAAMRGTAERAGISWRRLNTAGIVNSRVFSPFGWRPRSLTAQPEIRETDFPCEIKLCMKTILDGVINSLGWDEPAFRVCTAEAGIYSCEVLVLVKCDVGDSNNRKILVVVGEGSSEDKAVQNACQGALFLLEAEMSIRLLDVNYNRRCHAEMHLSKATEVQKVAVSIGEKIVAEWESLIAGLQACKEHTSRIVAEHPDKEPTNQLYNAKCECAALVGDLHGECAAGLALANEWHILLSSWVDQ